MGGTGDSKVSHIGVDGRSIVGGISCYSGGDISGKVHFKFRKDGRFIKCLRKVCLSPFP